MKKRLITLTIATIAVLSLSACGKEKNSTAPESNPSSSAVIETAEDTPVEEEEEIGGMGNPIEEVSYDKIVEATGCFVTLPADMEDPTYLLVNNELGEIRFKTSGNPLDLTFRVQKADEFTDISGLYYDFTKVDGDSIFDYETKQYIYSDDDENLNLILWYDHYTGIMYSLSAIGDNADSFDLYTMAVNMAMTDVPLGDYPSNDLEERTGKTEFDSYDEIIGLLKKDEAYALVNILGYDGEVLLVASGSYDNLDGNMAAIDATPYTMKSFGKVTADSMLSSIGTAYPLAIDDNGLIYCCGHQDVNAYCYGTNGTDDTGIMVMKYISAIEFDDNGKGTKVSGFYRDITNPSVIDNDTVDYNEDDVEALDAAFDEYMAAKVVNFTVVK